MCRSIAVGLVFFVIAGLLPLSSNGQDQGSLFSVDLPNAKDLALLRLFVRRFGKERVNHVHLAPALNDDGREYFYACWDEDDSILLLNHFLTQVPDNPEPVLDWLHHKARIDLKSDVVETEEETAGSTYLVDRAWVDRILEACRTGGLEVVITVSGRSRSRISRGGRARPN